MNKYECIVIYIFWLGLVAILNKIPKEEYNDYTIEASR